ncbi:MMPL family transporter [Chungangia koreensis]|uniref:MMPL family transporter n=1 Tax=Chungangia koreensis TaxID=752657 RepID=A0ABV8X9X8_9LACT
MKSKKWRITSLVIWIALFVLAVVTMPNLDELVREKGQIEIPDTFQSVKAVEMAKDLNEGGVERYQIIVVFNSGSEKALSEQQKSEIADVISELKSRDKELGILSILSHLDSEETEEQLVSEDGTTILTQIEVDQNSGMITEIQEKLDGVIKVEGVDTYLTGTDLVTNDFSNSTQDGVKKTEIIAVIFIVTVLVLIFRSPVVPLISLLSVGVSYIISLNIVAQMVDHLDFPFSNFTQVFIVVILFGIGTDYNILLFTRFKEELSKTDNIVEAVSATYKGAGKTILYSGIAVLIGFVSLGLASFKLYQASAAVAVGVAVLLAVIITLNPFFMAVLGRRMFWPVKRFEGHGDSKLWHFLSRHSVLRPLVALLFVAVICIPFIWIHSGKLNYNDLYEVADKYESKQGINVIEDHFEPGFSSPATFIIQSDQRMDDPEVLKTLDEIAEKIEKVDGVSKVMSPTRPTGGRIKELYISDQSETLNSGLGDAKSGIDEIHDGLSTAEEQVGGNNSDLSNVQQLIDGTAQLKNGVTVLRDALGQVTNGLSDGAAGADEIENGLASVNQNIATLQNGVSQLQDGYTSIQSGLGSFTQYFDGIKQAVDGSKSAFGQIEASMNTLVQAKPEMADDPKVQQTIGIAKAGQEQLNELSTQLDQMIPQYEGAINSFREANESLQSIEGGLAALQEGVDRLQSGAAELESGLQKGAKGSGQIAARTSDLSSGLSQVNDGQQQLLDGLSELQEKMGELQSGLLASTEGLGQVSEGLQDAQSYLGGLSESNETFYIPQEVLEGEEFQEALDLYMSEDRETVQMTIILDVNPFSAEAMDIVQDIDSQVRAAVKGTNLDKADLALGGKSSMNADLQEMSNGDFSRTATIMLIGIAIVLMIITRSFWQPLFIIGALVLAYFTSLGISELLSGWFLGINELSWNAPFFGFIMIVALGVDYSIFLMMRFKETDANPRTAIVEAARHLGGVVISAAIILGGTFAALIPSGIMTLIQVALVVIVGLALLSFVMMPILLPALIALSNKKESK